MTGPTADRSLDSAIDVDDLTSISNAVRILFRAIRLNNVDVERQMGISLAQLYVLEMLSRHPASSVNDLADLTRTHQSSVSVVVRKLTERGLVAKRTASDDARRAELSITDQGRDLLAGAPKTFQARLEQGLMDLGRDRTRVLAEALAGWLKACGLDDPAPPMLGEEEPRRRAELDSRDTDDHR